jgi:Rhodanese-like domain
MAVMVAGGLLVMGLVGWALTRSVEPAPVPATIDYSTSNTATPVPTPQTAPPPPFTATTASTPTSTVTPGSFSIPPGGQTQEPDKAQVGRVSAEDLYGRFTSGAVTIVDVRDAAAYQAGHIPGSLNIPMASLQTQIASLRTGKPVVAYCT